MSVQTSIENTNNYYYGNVWLGSNAVWMKSAYASMHVLHSHVSLSWHVDFATPVPGPHLNHHLLHGSLTYRLEPALGVYIIGFFLPY